MEDNSEAAKTAGLFLQSRGFVKHLTSYKHQCLLLLCLQRPTFFSPSNSYLLSLVRCNMEQSKYNNFGMKTNKSIFGCSLTCTEGGDHSFQGSHVHSHMLKQTQKLCIYHKDAVLTCSEDESKAPSPGDTRPKLIK